MKDWLTIAFSRQIVLRGTKVAMIVGTILVAINQGDAILDGSLTAATAWKIPMTYIVPYVVSTYAAVSAIIAHRNNGNNSNNSTS
jgi:hypothetical protein